MFILHERARKEVLSIQQPAGGLLRALSGEVALAAIMIAVRGDGRSQVYAQQAHSSKQRALLLKPTRMARVRMQRAAK
jgi:hypothetical protein